MGQWLMNSLMAAIWGYLTRNWVDITVYLAGAAIVCALVRKFLRLYKGLPLIVGVIVLIVGAWTVGYRSAPEKIRLQTIVRTEKREVPVRDDAEIRRLRNKLADMTALKDAADAARLAAESAKAKAQAALARALEELAAAKAEIQRLLAEHAEPPPTVYVDSRNGQCSRCRALFEVGSILLDHKETIRCPKCKTLMSALSAVNYRNIMLGQKR